MKIANLEARLGIDNWNDLTVAQQQYYITQELINQTTANFGNKTLKNTNSMLAQFKAQLSNTSLALGKAFKALLTVVLPYLTAFLKVLEKVFNYISTMITSLLSLFGITVDFTSNASSGIEAVGGDIDTSGLDGVSDGMDNVADGAEGAKDKIEEMRGSLAGFDELNTLSFSDNSDSDSGSGDIPAGGIDTSDLQNGLAELGESEGVFDVLQDKLGGFVDWFNKLIEKAKELAGLFKQGFDLSFDASKLKDIWESLKSIGESLKYIFFNEEVAAALDNLANKWAFAMGQIVGAIANIGASIIQMLVGGIAQSLDENKDWIKEKLITCIDVTAEIWEILGNFAQALSEIFGVLGEEEGKGIIANIVSGLTYAFGTHAEIMLKLGRDMLDLITGPIVDNVDAIKENFKSFLGTLEKITGTIKDSIKAVCDTISQTYDEKIAPTLQRLRDGFSDTMAKFQDVYAKYIQPVLDFMAEKFDMVMDKYITPALQNLVSLFGTLIEVLGVVYETALKPLIDFIIQVIVPVAMPILAAAWNTIVTVVGVVIGIIGDLLGVLDGFLTFLVGVFQGDWEKAWGGLQKCGENFFKIFTDLWDGFCSLFDNGKLYLESFKNFFKGMVDYIKGRMEYFKEKIGENAEKAWENIKKPFELMGQWFKDTFTKALDNIKNAWSGIKTWASEKYNDFTSAFSNFGTWCKDTWGKAYTLATGAWSNLKTWASGLPTTISNGLSNLSSTMSSKFSSAWTACKNAFSGVATWASGLASTIGDKFRNLGSTVGEAIGGAVKGAINGVISTIERTINGAVGIINGAIRLINKIPGVNVSTISSVSLPRLANGGLVTTSTLANIGEAGPEAVIPLNRSSLWAPQLAKELARQLTVSGINQSNTSSRPLEVKLVVDGRELGRASINNINKLQRESNEILLDI